VRNPEFVSYNNPDRPTAAEESDNAGELIECDWCGALTDADNPCHDPATGAQR
jgi:hypothetical protein